MINLADWPDLISEDYSFCQSLAHEAIDRTIDLFLAPSARRLGFVAIPVFEREALSNPVRLRTSAFRVAIETGETVEIVSQPD